MTARPYTIPVLCWTAAVAGLVLALLGEGWLDLLGLTLLGAPLIALLHASTIARR